MNWLSFNYSLKGLFHFLLLCVAMANASVAWGQQMTSQLNCGSDEVHQARLLSNLTYRNQVDISEKVWSNKPAGTPDFAVFTLPIVIHIVHNNGVENISDAQVLAAINHLNQAFANQGYYDPNNGVDVEVDFCLAKQDPQGNPTTGINRIISPLTNVNLATQDLDLKNLVRWDPLRYINIWIVSEICAPNNCSVAGYAYYPAAHGQAIDGIVVEAAYAGSSPSNSVVLIHEMGHYLGLYHTFEGSCTNNNCLTDGDRVCDTPPDQTTVNTPCSATTNSCASDEDDVSANNPFRSIALGGMGDQADQFQNYMDYSELTCYNQFTQGQKERIQFFIQQERQSLLNSNACFSPCNNPVSANFGASGVNVLLGQSVQFTNNSINANTYTWYLDGQQFSSAVNPALSFNAIGVFQVVLQAYSADQGCLPGFDTVQIEVTCPAQSAFSIVQNGLSIQTTNNSINANTYEWSVRLQNGTVIFTDTSIDLNYTFPDAGWYQICLTAIGSNCEAEECNNVQVFTPGNEDCINEIDDDGDGLVDAFDPDCPCNLDTYQAQCPTSCNAIPNPIPPFGMKLKWYTDTIAGGAPLMVVGDIDHDGDTEIICQGDNNKILILNGQDGTLQLAIPTLGQAVEVSPIAIADANRDGFAEIYIPIVLTATTQQIWCYNHLGVLLWQSATFNIPSVITSTSYIHLNLADFNADGIPEVYFGNIILNALTGVLLAQGVVHNNIYFFTRQGVAADFLPAPGLELVEGNTIYTVVINNPNGMAGNSMIPKVFPNIDEDALVGFADFDGDALPEVVSVEYGGDVIVWNPRTMSLLTEVFFQQDGRGSVPMIADIDGDCIPEIAIHVIEKINVYKFDGSPLLKLAYKKTTTDNSGWTGMTVFDFNQDGRQEFVFRDQTLLTILDAPTGNVLATYPINSLTGYEMPIVADLNQDGAAEILTNGSWNNGQYPNSSSIMVFESNGLPWAPARAIWNQSGYSVTHINDDLSVPRYPQNPAEIIPGTASCAQFTCPTPYNAFLVQATKRTQNGCIQFPAIDAEIVLVSAICTPLGLEIKYKIYNRSDALSIPIGTQVSFYDQNPLLGFSNLLNTSQLNVPISTLDSSGIFTTYITTPSSAGSIFLLINTSGAPNPPFNFPVNGIIECDYTNNLIQVPYQNTSPPPDLGPDRTMCVNQAINLTPGNTFDRYQWSDGSITASITIDQPGWHWVKTTDECGLVQTDSILLTIDPVTVAQLGPDLTICRGDTVNLSLSESFAQYQWFPPAAVNCANCNTVSISPAQNLNLTVLVSNTNGCYSTDSLQITVLDTPIQKEEKSYLCKGDSIQINGQWVSDAGTFVYQNGLLPCDTIFSNKVMLLDTFRLNQSYNLCFGDQIQVAGTSLSSAGTYYFPLMTTAGCDSILIVTIAQPDTVAQPELNFDCNLANTLAEIALEPGWSVLWSNGTTTAQTVYTTAGIGSLTINDTWNCVQNITFNLPGLPDTSDLPLFPDTALAKGQIFKLDLELDSLEWELSWSPKSLFNCDHCLHVYALQQQDATINIRFRHRGTGCLYERSFQVKWKDETDLYIPNVFAPEGSGDNLLWQIYPRSWVKAIIEASIYDRWGELVYQSLYPSNLAWDGQFNGQKAAPGVYVYKIKYQLENGSIRQVVGDLTLIR